MSRLGGAFWFILVVVTGMTNFIVKQTVQNLDDQLTAVQRKTIVEQREIHELSADWTFLNQPELLSDLNKRYLGLAPAAPKQVVASIDGLPLRPAVPPPQIAAATPAPAMPASTPNTAAQVAAVIPLEPATPVAAPPATATQNAEMIPLEPAIQAPMPVVPRSSAAPAPSPAPTVRVAAAVPVQPAVPASLDALFAQVSGGR